MKGDTMPGQKSRYLVSNKNAPQLDPETLQDLKSFIDASEEAELIKSTLVGRHVILMTEEQKRELEQKHPNLIIEPDHPIDVTPAPMLPGVVRGTGQQVLGVEVKDLTTSKPVAGVTIYGVVEGAAYKAETDAQGVAMLECSESYLLKVVASPRNTYWSRVVENVDLNTVQALEIKLKPLLVTGAFEWGHRLMGFPRVNRQWRGKGVRVGIIDSGITTQLADLRPAGGLNTLDGHSPGDWYVDEKGHGTHCR